MDNVYQRPGYVMVMMIVMMGVMRMLHSVCLVSYNLKRYSVKCLFLNICQHWYDMLLANQQIYAALA